MEKQIDNAIETTVIQDKLASPGKVHFQQPQPDGTMLQCKCALHTCKAPACCSTFSYVALVSSSIPFDIPFYRILRLNPEP